MAVHFKFYRKFSFYQLVLGCEVEFDPFGDVILDHEGVSPTEEPFGSVNARTRQVPVGTAELSGSVMVLPPAPWSASCARRNSTPSGRSITNVSGPPVTALDRK